MEFIIDAPMQVLVRYGWCRRSLCLCHCRTGQRSSFWSCLFSPLPGSPQHAPSSGGVPDSGATLEFLSPSVYDQNGPRHGFITIIDWREAAKQWSVRPQNSGIVKHRVSITNDVLGYSARPAFPLPKSFELIPIYNHPYHLIISKQVSRHDRGDETRITFLIVNPYTGNGSVRPTGPPFIQDTRSPVQPQRTPETGTPRCTRISSSTEMNSRFCSPLHHTFVSSDR